jgi:ATP-dependent metalloprotease
LATATVVSTLPSSQTSSTTPSEPIAETPASPAPPPQSRSELIAQKILSGAGLDRSSTGSAKVDPSLATALSGGAGVSGNPIHVTLAECEV